MVIVYVTQRRQRLRELLDVQMRIVTVRRYCRRCVLA